MSRRIFIAGGYGVFGSQIAREFARGGIPLTIAGRDGAKAAKCAAACGAGARGVSLDVRDKAACLRAFEGHAAVVHCAGPFSDQGTAVLESCIESRCHYADIADDRVYAAKVRAFDARFRAAGLVAAYGCSSLPGISGALARRLRDQSPEPPARVRVTLFIGNKNAKGEAAVRSVFRILGKDIRAPQGPILGFGDPETVALPPPWGRRSVNNFESPEYDLFPELFGARSVTVKLGFELGAVRRGLALLAGLPESWRRALLKPLVRIGNALSFFGSSGGAVMVEFFYGDGSRKSEALSAPVSGQRMAILPCVFVVHKLLSGASREAGAKTAHEILGADEMMTNLRSFRVSC